MERVLALLATLAVGGLIALQPPVNSQLARHTGTVAALFVTMAVGTVAIGLVFVATAAWGDLDGLRSLSPLYLTGGLMGLVLVGVSLLTVRTLGAGGVVAATVATQLVVSALLDRAGVLGLDRVALSPLRLCGFVLLLAGTLLVTLR